MISSRSAAVSSPESAVLVLDGLDGAGKPRQLFAARLAGYSVPQYLEVAVLCIVKAAAAGDPRSDWHWMSEACFEEARRRRCPGLYSRAVEMISGEPEAGSYLRAVMMACRAAGPGIVSLPGLGGHHGRGAAGT